MKSSVEALEGNKVKLSVEVEPEEFATELNLAFKKVQAQVKLPGFRKGKVPRQVIEARLGKDYTHDTALDAALPKYYYRAMLDCDVDAISKPQVKVTSTPEAESVTFEAVVEVRPEIPLEGYDSLKIEVPSLEPTPEELNQLLEQFGTLETVSRPAAENDHIKLDLRATYNGEVFSPFDASDYTYKLGSGATGLPDLDKTLTGSQAGQIFELNAPHPEDEAVSTTRYVRVKVLVKEILENKLPELTDEFAQQVSEFDTAAELRQDFSDKLKERRIQQAGFEFQRKLEEALLELVDVEVPDALIQQMSRNALSQLANRLQEMNINLAQYLEITRQSQGDLMEDIRITGERRAKVDLALRAVVRQENLAMADEAVEKEFQTMLGLTTSENDLDAGNLDESNPDSGNPDSGNPTSTNPASSNQASTATASSNTLAGLEADEKREQLKMIRTEFLNRDAFRLIGKQTQIVDTEGNEIGYEELFGNEESQEADLPA